MGRWANSQFTNHITQLMRILHKLYLIRHSTPLIQPALSASQWVLSDEGRRRARAFGDTFLTEKPARVITSHEPKAFETGQIIADLLGIPCVSADGLHEQRRENTPFLSLETFRLQVRELFERPTELVVGEESARQAQRRMVNAVDAIIRRYQRETIAIVSHGTVMSLFAAHWNQVDGYAIWQSLGMPTALTFTLPGYSLLEPQI